MAKMPPVRENSRPVIPPPNTAPKMRLAPAIAAACGSLTNTVFYLGLMLLFYVLAGINTAEVLALIGGTALVAGALEAVANAVVCPAVYFALSRTKLRV